jgi:sugar fermentation stimulation protein A
MQFDPPLLEGRFVRRYKRFFMDAELPDGRTVTAHCPNTGSLSGCLTQGAAVWLQPAASATRKLAWTWKLIRAGESWVGVDTSIANGLVAEALAAGALPELAGYERVIPEVPYGREGKSRIDLLLSSGGSSAGASGKRIAVQAAPGERRVYVEVKNTTLTTEAGGRTLGAFPDAVTERGKKHLDELIDVVRQGQRAAMVYSVQRSDCVAFTPADAIDPAYGAALREALAAGVEAYALAAEIDPSGVALIRRLPIEI